MEDIPPYTKNFYWPNADPLTMGEDIALKNGKFLLEKLELYLENKAISNFFQIKELTPKNTVSEEKKHAILRYFNTDERLIWLGRQFYLGNVYLNEITESSPILGDDVPLFFNWLTSRNAYHIPLDGRTPLQFGGRRRSKKNRKTKKRIRSF